MERERPKRRSMYTRAHHQQLQQQQQRAQTVWAKQTWEKKTYSMRHLCILHSAKMYFFHFLTISFFPVTFICVAFVLFYWNKKEKKKRVIYFFLVPLLRYTRKMISLASSLIGYSNESRALFGVLLSLLLLFCFISWIFDWNQLIVSNIWYTSASLYSACVCLWFVAQMKMDRKQMI